MISIKQEESKAKYSFFSPLQVWRRVLLSVRVFESRLHRERALHLPFSLSVSPFSSLFISWGHQKNSKHLFKVEVELVGLFHGPCLGFLQLKSSNAALVHIFTWQLKGWTKLWEWPSQI